MWGKGRGVLHTHWKRAMGVGGGGLHTRRFENFRTISSGEKKKKTLILTLGSPPKNGEKKNPGINLGQPAGKGREEKKNPGINPGQPVEKKRKKKSHVRLSVEVPILGIETSTDRQTDK